MKLKYKAILYETPEQTEYLFVSNMKQRELNNPKPIDSVLLDTKCYSTADKYFFNKRGWNRNLANYHIEIEQEPRMIEA
jgi:hypothetical protein